MANNYRDAVLSDNPAGYWRLGELTGSVAHDASGNGHDGSFSGPVVLGVTGAIAGDSDTAVGFRDRAYVEIPDSDVFSQPTSGAGLTVEVWMRPDALDFEVDPDTPYIHWLGKGRDGAQEWALRFYTKNTERSNRVSAYIFNPSGGRGPGAYFQECVTTEQWNHVVACYEPGDRDTDPPAGVHIYRNGVHKLGPPSPGTLYANPEFPVRPVHGPSPLRLGTRDLLTFFTGALDEVAIYPRVLSANEILNHYNLGRGT